MKPEVTDKGIVVNTSPWIALSICGQIPLLEKLYTDVCIPLHVKEEIMELYKERLLKGNYP